MTTRFFYNFQQQQFRIANENDFLTLRWKRLFSNGFSLDREMAQDENSSFFPDFLPESGAALYVPEHYEANYPYPLLIWLDEGDDSEGDGLELQSLMSQISTRNYVGMSFHQPKSDQHIEQILKRLHATVGKLRQVCHIHSERIYLAGIGESATLALRLLMKRPEWFAGAISLGGELPKLIDLSAENQQFQNKRVFQGSTQQGTPQQHSTTAQTVLTEWLLRKAGMQVLTKSYDAGARVSSGMLQDIDHWLMAGLCTGV